MFVFFFSDIYLHSHRSPDETERGQWSCCLVFGDCGYCSHRVGRQRNGGVEAALEPKIPLVFCSVVHRIASASHYIAYHIESCFTCESCDRRATKLNGRKLLRRGNGRQDHIPANWIESFRYMDLEANSEIPRTRNIVCRENGVLSPTVI